MSANLLPKMALLGFALLLISQRSFAQAPTSITISPANPATTGLSVQFSALNSTLIPLQSVVLTQTVQPISVGYAHSCVVLADGTVRCWGDNTYGQLGNGTTTASTTPVQVSGIGTAVAVAGGRQHTCAALSDGSVECWGDNTYGQLGDGTNTGSLTPVPVLGLGGGPETQISAGDFHTCVRATNSYVYCWGDNSSGQLGNGSTTPSNTPVSASGFFGPGPIATGRAHSCAVNGTNTVSCWGDNTYNQLGILGATQSTTPVVVSNLIAASVSAGGNETCAAASSSDQVSCWGSTSPVPAVVSTNFLSRLPLGIGDASATSGEVSACYVGQDAKLYCSVYSASEWSQPGPVTGLIGVNAGGISGNGSNICAYLGDGTVSCWLSPPPSGTYSPAQITNYLLPSGGTPQTEVAWSSSNPGVATISATGYAVPVALGTTTITATYGSLPAATTSLIVQAVPPPPPPPPVAPTFSSLPLPNVTAVPTNSTGATVTYPLPTATAGGGPVTVTCQPSSGSTFVVGTTTVTCTAVNDTAPALTATAQFTVTVLEIEDVTATGLTCSGCVGNLQLGIIYAAGDAQGGNALNALLFAGLAPNAFAPATGSPNYAPATGSTSYLAKPGDAMTGPLTLAPAAATYASLNFPNTGAMPNTPAMGDVWLTTADPHIMFQDMNNTAQKLAFLSDVGTSGSSLLGSNNTFTGSNTFSQVINGSINGNAATVSNGVYTSVSYADPVWITALSGGKITGSVTSAVTAGTATSATTASLAGNVTGVVAVANGGTGASTAAANTYFAGPSSGSAAPPAFRTLAPSDTHTVLNMDASTVAVRNTAAETTVYSFSVPAGTLSAQGSAVRVDLLASYQNDVALGDGFKVRVYYGGTVLWGDFAVTLKALKAGSLGGARLQLLLFNGGSSSAQRLGGVISFSSIPQSAAVTGSGAFLVPLEAEVVGSSSVDATTAQTFKITIQPNVANSSLAFTKNAAVMELVQ